MCCVFTWQMAVLRPKKNRDILSLSMICAIKKLPTTVNVTEIIRNSRPVLSKSRKGMNRLARIVKIGEGERLVVVALASFCYFVKIH